MLISIEEKRLVADEVKEIKSVAKSSELKLRQLILQIAEKYDKSGLIPREEIGTRIRALLKDELDQDYTPSIDRIISYTLPTEYKKETSPTLDLTPESDLQEFLVTQIEIGELWRIVSYECLIKLKKQRLDEEQIGKDLDRKLSVSISDLVAKSKDLLSELILTKEHKLDIREKLSPWIKFRVQLLFLEKSLHEIAEIVGQSAKWQKDIVKGKNADKIQAFIAENSECPVCHWDMKDWFDKNFERYERGLPIIPPNSKELKEAVSRFRANVVASTLGITPQTVNKVVSYFFSTLNQQK